jgi:hypothetical protein
MIGFLKKYWLFIMINVAILLVAALFFMIVINSPQEGKIIYQI